MRDSLFVKVVVIDVESEKLAIVGLDLGRSPTDAMMARIRTSIKDTSNVGLVLISGSHTHHGPVIELLDEPGKGKDAFAWYKIIGFNKSARLGFRENQGDILLFSDPNMPPQVKGEVNKIDLYAKEIFQLALSYIKH